MFRNRWNVGSWLVQDEESGRVKYAEQTKFDWKGLVVTKRYADYEQPQDYICPSDDPRPAPFLSRQPDKLTLSSTMPFFIGQSPNLTRTRNAAAHLFTIGGEPEASASAILLETGGNILLGRDPLILD